MGILGYVVYPALTPDRETNLLGAGTIRVGLMTVGLVWVFVLAMLIVYREEGDLRWTTIRRRLWLNAPLDPKTGEPRRKLWLWLIPIVVLSFAGMQSYGPALIKLWTQIFPFLAPPPGYNPAAEFMNPEVQGQLVGAWGFYGLFFLLSVFNIFGEEFLFRGVLLPKMEGVFGKWDWVANGVLFGLYHFHEPWVILPAAIDGAIYFAFPTRRFRCTWLAIIGHSAANVIFLPLILLVVLGLV